MELVLVEETERKLALYRDESAVRLRAGDGSGASQALRHARSLAPDDVALAQEFGTSVISRIDMGEDVPSEEREEARAIFVSFAESYDGDYGMGYAESALRCTPGDDRAMQLAVHYAKQLNRVAELKASFSAYLSANPAGYMAQEARAAVGAAPGTAAPVSRAPGSFPQQAPAQSARASAPQASGQPFAPSGTSRDAAAFAQPRAVAQQADDGHPSNDEHDSMPEGGEHLSGREAPAPRMGSLPQADPNEQFSLPQQGVAEVRTLIDQAQIEAQKGRKPTALIKFRDALKLDPANSEALAWVDEHLRQKRMYTDLREVLLAASRVHSQPLETRKAQLRDIAGICETQLRDIETAISCAKQIVQLDRGDEPAREQLRRLLEKAQKWDDLATVLEQEAMNAPDVETKIALEKKLAGLHEQKRKDPGAAAEAWARIAGLAPSDDVAIHTAVKLFEKGNQFALAANVIAENVSSIEDAAQRGALLGKLGELRIKSGDAGGAGDAFAEAAEASGNEGLSTEATKLRSEMWEKAEKAYVDASRFIEAANALDQRAKGDDSVDRVGLLVRAAELYQRAEDPGGAIEKLLEASALDPSKTMLSERLEALFRSTERLGDFANHLGQRAEKIADKDQRAAVRFKAADVQRELGDSDAARETLLLVLNDGESEPALS